MPTAPPSPAPARRILRLLRAAGLLAAAGTVAWHLPIQASLPPSSSHGPGWGPWDAAEWQALTDPDAALRSIGTLKFAPTSSPKQRLAQLALQAHVAAASLDQAQLDTAIMALERWPAGPLQAQALALASCAIARRENQPTPEHERLPDLEPLLQLPEDEGLLRAHHRCLLVKAQLHGAMGQHEQAQQSALRALEISERLGPPWRRILSKIELAQHYIESHQEEPAQRFLAVAEQRLGAMPDAHYLWYRLLALKSRLLTDVASAEALQADQQGLAHARAAHSPRLLAKALNNVADQHLRMGQAAPALKAAEEALAAAREAQRMPQQLQALQLKGLALVRLGQLERGLAEFSSALALSGQGRLHAGSVESLRALAEQLEATGQLELALDHYHQYREAFDQLFAKRTTEVLLEAQAQFDARRREQSLALYKAQGDLAEQQLRRERLQIMSWTFASVVAAGLLAAMLFILRRLRSDNSQLQQANDALHHGSSHDVLTGLLNRHGLASKLQERTPEQPIWPATLCLADIDHFKQINDRWGHRTGDLILQQLARHVERHLPQGALAARWGGEEFLLILPGESPGAARPCLQALLQMPGLPAAGTAAPSGPPSVSCSIGGVWVTPAMAATLRWEELLEMADQALYGCKRDGRQQACVWQPDPGVSPERWRQLLASAEDASQWPGLTRHPWRAAEPAGQAEARAWGATWGGNSGNSGTNDANRGNHSGRMSSAAPDANPGAMPPAMPGGSP